MRIFFLILIFVLSVNLYSQFDKSQYYDYSRHFYYDLYYQQPELSDSIDINVLFKLSFNQLKFIKDEDNSLNEDVFRAKYNIEAEFRDADGIIRKRIIKYDTIMTNNYSDINNSEKLVYHLLGVRLLPGKYAPVLRIYDNDKSKLGEEKLKEIDFVNSSPLGRFSSCLFAYQGNDNNYYQFILNGNAGFSSNDVKLIFHVSEPRSNDYNYKIEYLDANNSPIPLPEKETVYGTVALLSGKDVQINIINKNVSIVNLIQSEDNSGLLIFNLPADRTIPGKSRISIWDDKASDTLKFDFIVIWENMPAYLKNPGKAVEIMYYVLNDSEYDEMNSGNDKEKLKKIFEWWRAKDPTKFSIYNEAMVEYFRRADYSSKNYKTNFEKDGVKTDRGKIYILNGPPDKIDMDMQINGQSTEIWNYKRLNKKFVFLTDKNGVIYLKEIKPI